MSRRICCDSVEILKVDREKAKEAIKGQLPSRCCRQANSNPSIELLSCNPSTKALCTLQQRIAQIQRINKYFHSASPIAKKLSGNPNQLFTRPILRMGRVYKLKWSLCVRHHSNFSTEDPFKSLPMIHRPT